MSPVISVIIPLHDGRRFITQALGGVAAQTLSPHEIIVVDDGSTDDGPALVDDFARTFPVKLIRRRNRGVSAARNLGVAHSTGDLVALLDQDDIWYPDHLAELVKPFLEDNLTRPDWAYSDLDEIDECGRLVTHQVLQQTGSRHPKTDLPSCLRQDMFVLPSASLISRPAFDAVGGFDESLCGYEDDDLFVRLFSAGYRHAYIDKALSQWRIHPGGTSFSPHMSSSRAVFARKVLDTYPVGSTCDREAILARFLNTAAETMRLAVSSGRLSIADACKTEIATLEGYLSEAGRNRLARANLLTTVIIPLRNGARYIVPVLNSVLGQTVTPDEIIVVDCGSTDDGPAIVASMADGWPIRLLSAGRSGLGMLSARNQAVAQAHGDVVAILEQTDIWYPAFLETLLLAFKQRRARPLGWSFGNLDKIDPMGRLVAQSILHDAERRPPDIVLPDCLVRDVPVRPAAALIARGAFEAVGGFDESLADFADEDFFVRLLVAGYGWAFSDEPVCQCRVPLETNPQRLRSAAGRMAYTRKLIATFSSDAADPNRRVADRIASRFMGLALVEARAALAGTDQDRVSAALREVEFLDNLMLNGPDARLTKREPLISVVIPLFNGAAFIAQAIASVMNQSRLPDEVIVVDDGSTDEGPAIVSRLAGPRPLRLIRQNNAGQSSARNNGVDCAHGDLIAFLDQDDIWYDDHLAELVKPFLQHRSTPLGWSYSNLDEINRDGEVVHRRLLDPTQARHPKRDVFTCLSHDMFILPSASLVSRRAFLSQGGFDERLSGYEDDDLFLRLFVAGFDNTYLDKPLSQWRIYQTSSSYSPRMAISRVTYARKLIARFPDDPDTARYYTRDMIAPRFYHLMATELRKSVLKGTRRERIDAVESLAAIIGHLRTSHRLPLQLVFLPAMRVPLLARWIMRHRIPLAAMLRRLF